MDQLWNERHLLPHTRRKQGHFQIYFQSSAGWTGAFPHKVRMLSAHPSRIPIYSASR